jgi:hypothetical protein
MRRNPIPYLSPLSLSGALPATVFVTPFDVFKTRMQVPHKPSLLSYINSFDCLWKIWNVRSHFLAFSVAAFLLKCFSLYPAQEF